jgi:hypothetical protein
MADPSWFYPARGDHHETVLQRITVKKYLPEIERKARDFIASDVMFTSVFKISLKISGRSKVAVYLNISTHK